jgi:hypothetical protein
MTSISDKIKSFIENGLVPGGKDLTNQKSFDSSGSGSVHLNSITRIEGIALSLFHKAKGGLTVATEEKEGSEGIYDKALERNRTTIDNKVKELGNLRDETDNKELEEAAIQEVLNSDIVFIQELSEKAHKTALFLVNIDIEPDEKNDKFGCNEITRGVTIPAEKFTHLIISDQYEETLKSKPSEEEVESGVRRDRVSSEPNSISEELSNIPRIERIFVNTVSSNINFSYKTRDGSTVSFLVKNVPIPNYEQVLMDIASKKIQETKENNGSPSSEDPSVLQRVRSAAISQKLYNTPIVSHMTRL